MSSQWLQTRRRRVTGFVRLMKHQIYESICRLGADETWSLARRLVAEHLTTNAAMEVNLSAHIRGRIELTMATAHI